MNAKEIKAIGLRVRDYRENAGLTQFELATAADIETNTVSRTELANTIPKLETVIKIANALGITPNDLLLESFDAPIEMLDAEIADLLKELDNEDRKKVIEYIRFLKSQK